MVQNWNDMYAFSLERHDADPSAYGYMKSLYDVYFSSGFLFSYGGYIFGNNNTDASDIGFAAGEAEKGAWVLEQLASAMNEECIDDTITTNAYSKLADGTYFATISTPDVYSSFLDEMVSEYKSEGMGEEEAESTAKEELYDGFYAVMTNLEGNIEEIIKINKQRWEIEENFRIMKTEFEARPVYVRRDDRIKAHFMTCYISLLLYRLLEKKIKNSYTAEQIIETLRSMKMTLLNTANGYVPSYTRTEITDSLHQTFGFRTDYKFIKKSTMRSIIKQTKEINLP